jgi:truncated hemoglobin YjbI
MYINKIDDLIDNVIDDFYVNIILKDKNLSKIFKEPNFVKYQKDINSIMSSFANGINLSEIFYFGNTKKIHSILFIFNDRF